MSLNIRNLGHVHGLGVEVEHAGDEDPVQDDASQQPGLLVTLQHRVVGVLWQTYLYSCGAEEK